METYRWRQNVVQIGNRWRYGGMVVDGNDDWSYSSSFERSHESRRKREDNAPDPRHFSSGTPRRTWCASSCGIVWPRARRSNLRCAVSWGIAKARPALDDDRRDVPELQRISRMSCDLHEGRCPAQSAPYLIGVFQYPRIRLEEACSVGRTP